MTKQYIPEQYITKQYLTRNKQNICIYKHKEEIPDPPNRECWHIVYSLFLSPSPAENREITVCHSLQRNKQNQSITKTIHGNKNITEKQAEHNITKHNITWHVGI